MTIRRRDVVGGRYAQIRWRLEYEALFSVGVRQVPDVANGGGTDSYDDKMDFINRRL